MLGSIRTLLLLCLTFLASHTSFAKELFLFRKFLNWFHIQAEMGYGHAWYDYKLVNTSEKSKETDVVFREGDKFYIHTGELGVVYQIRWLENVYFCIPSYTDVENLSNEGGKKRISKAEFKGKGASIPIMFSVCGDLRRELRLGVGGAFFINTLECLEHTKEASSKDDEVRYLGVYTLSQKKHYQARPYLILGFKLIDNSAWSVLLNTNLGLDFTYSASAWKCLDVSNLGAYNIGITIEKHISAYFRLSSKLLYEKSSSVNVLGKDEDKDVSVILEKQNVFFQFGFSFNCPEIPRCSLPSCRTERKHKHGGVSYRGSSIFATRDAQGRRLYLK